MALTDLMDLADSLRRIRKTPLLLRCTWLCLAALPILMVSACAGDELIPPSLDTESRYIIGGAPESGYDAVGALVADGEDFCTGTLVRPTVLVTAAHCIAYQSAAGMSVFFGDDVDRPASGESVAVSALYPHPSYDDYETRNDIGVVLLAAPATVDPIDVQTTPMTSSWVGREALFVGFGVTSAMSEAAGVKYSVHIPITEVSERTFTYSGTGVNTCFGDSGGPALYDGTDGAPRLIGVTSWGDEECADFGVNTRVDAFLEFLQPFLDGETPPPTDPGGGGGDWCEAQGWYGDGVCDPDCPQHDSDCGAPGSDWCAAQGWYGDGICDPDCPQPDSDCGGGGGGDWCGSQGWYGDGICDADCPQPDPDCGGGGGGGDWCEAQGWYGDGICDEDCPQPDPDCGGEPGGGTEPPAADSCDSEGRYGDGVCDSDCPNPDPDCDAAPPAEPTPDPDGGSGEPAEPTSDPSDAEDVCRDEGRYGDGVCDSDCPYLDPDCRGVDDASEEAPSRSGEAIGCSVGGGASSSTGLALLIALVPLVVRRRRV